MFMTLSILQMNLGIPQLPILDIKGLKVNLRKDRKPQLTLTIRALVKWNQNLLLATQ